MSPSTSITFMTICEGLGQYMHLYIGPPDSLRICQPGHSRRMSKRKCLMKCTVQFKRITDPSLHHYFHNGEYKHNSQRSLGITLLITIRCGYFNWVAPYSTRDSKEINRYSWSKMLLWEKVVSIWSLIKINTFSKLLLLEEGSERV